MPICKLGKYLKLVAVDQPIVLSLLQLLLQTTFSTSYRLTEQVDHNSNEAPSTPPCLQYKTVKLSSVTVTDKFAQLAHPQNSETKCKKHKQGSF